MPRSRARHGGALASALVWLLASVAAACGAAVLLTAPQSGPAEVPASTGPYARLCPVFGMAVGVAGDEAVICGLHDRVDLIDLRTGRTSQLAPLPGSGIGRVAHSRRGSLVVGGYDDGAVRLARTDDAGEAVNLPGTEPQWVTALALSDDDALVACGYCGGAIILWDTTTGRVLWRRETRSPWIECLRFSPDGKTLACGLRGGEIDLRSVAGGDVTATLTGHQWDVRAAAFTEDSRHLVSGSLDGTVRRWDLDSGAECSCWRGANRHVFGLAVSPDGGLVAVGGDAGSIELWDACRGEIVGELVGHDGFVSNVAFLGAGADQLASASFDGTVRVWSVAQLTMVRCAEFPF